MISTLLRIGGKLKILSLIAFFLFISNAQAAFREIECSVMVDGQKEDKSLIYLGVGSSVLTRFSVAKGASELFVVIVHKPFGPSQISVHSLNPAGPKGTTASSKTDQNVKMKELKTNMVSIPVILTKYNNKSALVECKVMK
jgi:hypothetical protein